MKPVAFLRSPWKRKDNKCPTSTQPPTDDYPLSRSSTSSLLPIQSAITINDMDAGTSSVPLHKSVFTRSENCKGHDTSSDIVGTDNIGRLMLESSYVRPRTFSVGTIVAEADRWHGPPLNHKHGPPDNSRHGPPARSPTKASFTLSTPPRPPRPSPPNISLRPEPPHDIEHNKTPGARAIFSDAMPSDTQANNQDMQREMELECVWEGFLRELDEDPDTLNPRSPLMSGSRQNAAGGQAQSQNLRPFNSKYQSYQDEKYLDRQRPWTTDGSAQIRRKRYLTLQASRSTPSLQHLDQNDTRADEDTLSLFPTPPPLVIKKRKDMLKPLVLPPAPTIAPPLPSPSTSTPDSTPVATPTTPRFPNSPSPHVARKAVTPTSILKKRPLRPITQPGLSSVTEMPESPSPTSPSFESQLPPTRPLRITHSAPHIKTGAPGHAVAHRATSSDPTPPFDSPSQGTLHIHANYLQSKGRLPPQPSRRPRVHWGYAV